MPFTVIEDKHIYQNNGFYVNDKTYLPLKWTNSTNLTYTAPGNVLQPTTNVKAWTLPVPQQGTTENARIGNKISPQKQ